MPNTDLLLKNIFIFIGLFFISQHAISQNPKGSVILDGTQNPPEIVYADVSVAVSDNGTGNYVLTFEDPIAAVSGQSFSKGPLFDVQQIE